MVCRVDRINAREDIVLVSHHPILVFTIKAEHLEKIQQKPDGHYNREDMMTLVTEGHAVLYDVQKTGAAPL